ncbi:hypothetical protein [Kallipyga gabonensis]|uniref:hypothetical protein n=1 Tax=Kallipyga gabonensis TaxID=1686287 RepID=UPI0006B62E4C|nr:hypothetical protein [Kallipyga gabonensis]
MSLYESFVDTLIKQTESHDLTWTVYGAFIRGRFATDSIDLLFTSNEYREVDISRSFITLSENLIISIVYEPMANEPIKLYINDLQDGPVHSVPASQEKLESLSKLAFYSVDPSYRPELFDCDMDKLISEYLTLTGHGSTDQ